MSHRTSYTTTTFSLPIMPRMSGTPKKVSFKVCVTYRNRENIKYIDIAEDASLEQLKWEIYKIPNFRLSPANFTLTVYDEVEHVWKPISEEYLSTTIVKLPFTPWSFLNVEEREKINANEQHQSPVEERELNLKLCERPLDKSSFIYFEIRSSATLDLLKEQARKKVSNQRTYHLLLWTKDRWTQLKTAVDDVSLVELGFTDYSFISFESEDDSIPGVCGLTNLGNTCFMNSALQCLSNIPELTQKILSFDDQINAPIVGAYTTLIKTIWSGEHAVTAPSSLLVNICENLPRFTRYRQHDAQEFMNHFLHLIHQEFTNERTLVTDLFYGRVQSSVRCLGGCKSIETNEETISFLPLPMEDDTKQHHLLYLESNGERHFVSVHARAKTIENLIGSFIEEHRPKLSSKHIQAVRIMDNRIIEKYWPSTWLIDTATQQLAFMEVPEKTVEQTHIELQFRDEQTRKSFRPPIFLVRPSYGCRYSNLSEQINQVTSHLCSVTDAPASACHLYWINDRYERRDLNTEMAKTGELFFMHQLVIEMESNWIQNYTNRYNFERPSNNTTLNTLLTGFFREESLNGDYYCSQCSTLKQAKQKADLALPLPRVLIIQLKRFTYDIHSDAKIDTHIDFPLRDLDLYDYIAENNKPNANVSTMYDLVAVSNHTGTLASGHYTTYAQNYRNHRWYSFNDEMTREIRDERDVVTKNAYILVYVQRAVS